MYGLSIRIRIIWVIGACPLLVSPVSAGSSERPPNIVLLLVDDMGWTGARYSGSDLHETPNINRLATEGMQFTAAYAAAPVCTPTRASIMTGKSPARLHMTVWHESAKNQVLDRKLLPPDTHGSLPLAETTIADRTLVIFTSDNGGFINEHRGQRVTVNRPLRSGKGSLYEGGIRVPMIVRWPGVTAPGSVCDEAIVSTDFYPTLLEATGLSAGSRGAEIDGKSIVPLLKNPKDSLGRDAIFFHYPHYYPTTSPVSAVRAGDWKLLEYHEDSHIELYNLKDDLGETKNLATRLPDKANELRRRLHTWRERVDAQMPTSNPGFRQPNDDSRAKKRA